MFDRKLNKILASRPSLINSLNINLPQPKKTGNFVEL